MSFSEFSFVTFSMLYEISLTLRTEFYSSSINNSSLSLFKVNSIISKSCYLYCIIFVSNTLWFCFKSIITLLTFALFYFNCDKTNYRHSLKDITFYIGISLRFKCSTRCIFKHFWHKGNVQRA